MIRLRQLHCSFCRKSEREVAKLVAGPRAYICDECVAKASRIMEGDYPPPTVTSSNWKKLRLRISSLWQSARTNARQASAI